MKLKGYIENRARVYTADSEFSCPDWCDRFGCNDARLHISVSIIDVAAASLVTGTRASHLFRSHYKIGSSPADENPWVQRFTLELQKPCSYFAGKGCNIYPGRPIPCALFPEALFLLPGQETVLDEGMFGHYPCLQQPPMISEKRRSKLIELTEMTRREAFLTEFYFFGFSPFSVDLRNTVMDVVELSRDISCTHENPERPYRVPHEAFEHILVQRLGKGGYLADIDSKVEELDSPRGIEVLGAIKEWTDSVGTTQRDFPYCYEFDENDRLRLVKRAT